MIYSLVNDSPLGSSSTWRPWPLRISFLAAFCMLCVLLGLILELIICNCPDTGCRVFGKASFNELSPTTYFVYNLLPSIITLVLGLVWAIVHHDVLRMEPYFQMSAPGGASAENSLFLKYSYTFLMYIPIEALRRRHYVVFLSSCILFLINMLVTPLGSGIFDDATVLRSSLENATRAEVYPPDWLSENLGGSFSHMTYSNAWLNGSLPPFTTPEYALLPVQASSNIDTEGEIWVAETTLFEAGLTCGYAKAEADLRYSGNSFIVETETQRFNYSARAISDNSLAPWTSVATPRSIHASDPTNTYLYIWASDFATENNTTSRDISARICNTSYYSQPVIATFKMPSGQVMHIDRTGPRKPFNNTARFEHTVEGSSYTLTIPKNYYDSSGALVGLGYVPNSLTNHDSQLLRRFGRGPEIATAGYCDTPGRAYCPSTSAVVMDRVMSLSGLCLYNQTNETLAQLIDPEILEQVYNSALRLMFAMAVTSEMVDSGTKEVISVRRIVEVKGFKVNHLWARGTQGSLGVIILLTAILALINRRRRCELDGEPNSMAAALRLLWASPELSKELEDAEFNSLKTLSKRLDVETLDIYRADTILEQPDAGGDRRYILQLVPSQGPRVKAVGSSKRVAFTPSNPEQLKPWIEEVWQLLPLSGVGLVIVLGIILGVLVAAFGYSRGHNGLTAFASKKSSFEYKVLYSYIPIALGMAVEPVLVTLASCHYMLAPYKALIRGQARSSESIAVDYDKSPPHFQLLRSLRGRHIGLALLTITLLLSNVLTVALAGLFSPVIAQFSIETQVLAAASPKIHGHFTEPAYEMYYTLVGNLSHDITAPSWTTSEYYVLPFSLAEDYDGLRQYEGPTFGIGADVNCSIVPDTSFKIECFEEGCSKRLPEQIRIFINVTLEDPCWPHLGLDWRMYSNVSREFEYLMFDRSSDHFARSVTCPDTFFVLWVEQPADPNPELTEGKMPYLDHVDATILKCLVGEKITSLTATVDDIGTVASVIEHRTLDELEVNNFYENRDPSQRLLPTFLDSIYNGVMENDGREDHSLMWLNYAMTILEPSIVQNKTNITHLPDQSRLITTFESVFRGLFVINLRLYISDILEMGELNRAPATSLVKRDVVNMNRIMFLIAVAIIIYIILALVMLYWIEAPKIPGHLPYCLAGMYTLLYASSAKEQCGRVNGAGPEERAERLAELRGLYSFGKFTGVDGRDHFGVYQELTEESKESDDSHRMLMEK